MPPALGRMHPSHMSNPFAAIPPHTGQYSASQSRHLPSAAFGQDSFASSTALNGGISPFAPTSAYGGSAFATANAASPSTFSAAAAGLGGQGGQGLASVAAQQGFARGAAMQEHSQAQLNAASMQTGGVKSGPNARIREVWRGNLEQEFAALRQLILKYPYVSMDAEFPGIVARPIGNFAGSKAEYHYQTLRCNVDLLEPIQLGITLWTVDGELPPPDLDPATLNTNSRAPNGSLKPAFPTNNLIPCPCTWVFNFSFDLQKDMYSTSSINLLRESGVDFNRHAQHGISPQAFGSLLTTSGLTFSPNVHWLSFHSGYDFGYLLKLLTNTALPSKPEQFFDLVRTFFPKLWDIKFLLRHAQRLRGLHPPKLSQNAMTTLDALGQKSGLSDLATELDCQRIGVAHTGGSDAWLTGSVFFAMTQKIFTNSGNNGQNQQTLSAELDSLSDQIYGLHGVGPPASQQYREEFFAAQGTPQQQGPNGTSSMSGAATGFTPNANPSTPTSSHAGLNAQTPGAQHAFGPALGGGAGFGQFGGFNK